MSASFSIVIEGKGTFTASIADPEASVTVGTNTPASFTAEVAPVGPAGATGSTGATGATGATGPAGVVAATAPITYNSGTQTVAIDTAYFVRSPLTAPTDGQIISYDEATARPLWIDNAARTLFATVRNQTGATLTAGTVVYISGAAGNKALVTKAQANSEASSSGTFAVISASISNNQNGTAVVAGELSKLNTTAYAEGATLYLSPTTAGAFTTTKPVAPNHIVYVATVTRVHANQGTIEVRIQDGSELDEQADVLLTSKTNNDLLVYESATSLWKNKSFATLGLLTAPYNPFNQTLNTSSTVQFGEVSISGLTGLAHGINGTSVYAVNTSGSPKGASLTGDGVNLIGAGKITFNDSTQQTTAFTGPQDLSAYAPLASPTFTGNPIAPTPTAGDNDTSIATTAFVNTYCPAASDTTAGKVELATDAEAIAGTDTARAMTPQTANAVSYLEAYDQQDVSALGFNASVSVQSVLQAASYKNLNHGASTAIGSSYLACLNFNQVGNTTQSVGINWTKKVILTFNLSRSTASPSAGSVFRACLGKTQAGGAVGDLINTGIGIKIEGSGVVQLMAYNAGALVTNNTSYTPSGTEVFAVKLVSYGNGTVECFINGNSVGTNTNAPTAIAAAFLYNTTFECQQVASVATTAQWTISHIKQSFGKR
jgi:hypothetical protein